MANKLYEFMSYDKAAIQLEHVSNSETGGKDLFMKGIFIQADQRNQNQRVYPLSEISNAVKSVSENIIKFSPNAIIIVVSNPMDTMTYLAHKATGLPKNQIIGMGGALDSARFKYRLSEALGAPASDVDGMVIGGHSDTGMIPLTRLASYNGTPVSQHLSAEALDKVAAATMVGGATLTKLLGTSAWYAPGASVSYLVDSIVNDLNRMIPCSVFLDGEYGQKDICIGVPCIIGKNGLESIIDVKLNDQEKEKFTQSAAAVRNMNEALKEIL